MIQVHQIDRDAAGFDHNLWMAASMPVSRDEGDDTTKRDEAIRALFHAGAYTLAALVQTDDLEAAYLNTQNGVRTPSWSRQPVTGVTPSFPGYHLIKGEKYGYQSTSMGDLLVQNDRLHVVAMFGFEHVELG
jgi:hypothetical protein